MTTASSRTPDHVSKLATEHCHDCSWYHGFWPLIRALGFGTVPEDHRDFYQHYVEEALKSGPARKILVCGAADASMPLLIHQIFEDLGLTPSITVIDRCETPLALSREILGDKSVDLKTIQASALDTQIAEPFDLIVTHSFLGYFSDEERQTLLSNWAKWLRPNGAVLTVNRLRENAGETTRFSPEEARQFIRRILDGVARTPELTHFSENEIRSRAQSYVQNFSVRPLTSLNKFVALCRNAGFEAHATPLPNIRRSGPTGPTAPSAATYLGFWLTKI